MKKKTFITTTKRRKLREGKRIIFFFVFLFGLSLMAIVVAYTGIVLSRKTYISPVPLLLLRNGLYAQPKFSTESKKLSGLLQKNNIVLQHIVVGQDSALYTSMPTGEQIIFASDKPLDIQVSSLQLVLSRLTIEGKRFSKLDFRFDKPVIVLK